VQVHIKTLNGKEIGVKDLSDHIFSLDPREDIIHRCVRWQLAKRRLGTHSTQTRSEVARTSKKMYKQKGTGRARHGSGRVVQFRGGAPAFGPHPRSHSHDLPKKIRALALRHALSSKLKDSSLFLLDQAVLSESKTSILSSFLSKEGIQNALIVGGATLDVNFEKAVRNLKNISVLPVVGINVYDILRRHTLILTMDAVSALEARFS
jgi:large subunit ribosomal protein L4